jgi:hypothetical protein
MDPYLEAQGFWQDFHVRMIALTSEALASHLPDHYAALIEERISLVDLSGDAFFGFRPDLAIAHEERPRPRLAERGQVATLEPVSVRLARKDLDQIPERWIEIKRLPDLSLVTVIEILSPTNKSGMGRTQYLHKRQQFLDQPVHLVEIDLLLGGFRLPMGAPLPSGDYFAILSRQEWREDSDVYAWSVRRPLPTIPIPLSKPDPDISLDIAHVVARAYEQGRYARLVNYAATVDLPLAEEDRAWVKDLASTRKRST